MRQVLVTVMLLLMAGSAFAALKTTGSGGEQQFDSSGFPQKVMNGYQLFKAKCTTCHSQQRVVVAFSTGVAPISGQVFDQDAMKAITFRMIRKANAGNRKNISKEEGKEISRFLNHLLNESVN